MIREEGQLREAIIAECRSRRTETGLSGAR
jgi:hypothetical protein